MEIEGLSEQERLELVSGDNARSNPSRWLPVLGPNTHQWWIYDEKDDVYVDPPKDVLDDMQDCMRIWGVRPDEVDLVERMWVIEILTDPDWLYDQDARYADIEI